MCPLAPKGQRRLRRPARAALPGPGAGGPDRAARCPRIRPRLRSVDLSPDPHRRSHPPRHRRDSSARRRATQQDCPAGIGQRLGSRPRSASHPFPDSHLRAEALAPQAAHSGRAGQNPTHLARRAPVPAATQLRHRPEAARHQPHRPPPEVARRPTHRPRPVVARRSLHQHLQAQGPPHRTGQSRTPQVRVAAVNHRCPCSWLLAPAPSNSDQRTVADSRRREGAVDSLPHPPQPPKAAPQGGVAR